MSKNNSERYAHTVDSQVPIRGKYKRNIIDIAKAFFRTSYRSTELNRVAWRFDVHTVDANPEDIKKFMSDNTMCHVENTFSKVVLEARGVNHKSQITSQRKAVR